jgi:hypothetical protein
MLLNGGCFSVSAWVQRGLAKIASMIGMGRFGNPVSDGSIEGITSMFRKMALALIATSLLAAPALANTTKPVSPQAAFAAKEAGKTVTTVKRHRIHVAHRGKTRHLVAGKHRTHVFAVRQGHRVMAGHHRHHIMVAKHGTRVHVAKHRHQIVAGKHRAHVKHVVTLKTNKTVNGGKIAKAKAQAKTHINRTVKVKKVKTHRTTVRAA